MNLKIGGYMVTAVVGNVNGAQFGTPISGIPEIDIQVEYAWRLSGQTNNHTITKTGICLIYLTSQSCNVDGSGTIEVSKNGNTLFTLGISGACADSRRSTIFPVQKGDVITISVSDTYPVACDATLTYIIAVVG